MSERQAPYRVEGEPVALMQCPVAGFQYHDGEACWSQIRVEDRLDLKREPGNRHDPRAITVQWRDIRLGYVPRAANYALSQMMDRGMRAEGRVRALRPSGDPWQRVMIEVVVFPLSMPAPKPEKGRPTEYLTVCRAFQPRERSTLQLITPSREGWKLSDAEYELGLRVFRACLGRLDFRLAMPVWGYREEHRRWVRVWLAVDIVVGIDGSGLTAVGGALDSVLTADLKRPIGPGAWLQCFGDVEADEWTKHTTGTTRPSTQLQRWVRVALRDALDGVYDLDAQRRAILDFLALDPLARSLANRIFGGSPSAEAFNWVCARKSSIALTAVEQPAMLPFLRIAFAEKGIRSATDPLSALRERFTAAGMTPAAWQNLPRWGFDAFAAMGEAWLKEIPVARFANLLHRLGVDSAPPPTFARHAIAAALFRFAPNKRLDFERYPDWFLRALLRECAASPSAERQSALEGELRLGLDWLAETGPWPDANQRKAGWRWIRGQALEWRKQRELARLSPWQVPVGEMTFGPWLVVPVRCLADLAQEAAAMKNCLASYEDACRAGEVIVFSIRDRLTGARVACCAAQRAADCPWDLIEVARKMNATVGPAIRAVAEAAVASLR